MDQDLTAEQRYLTMVGAALADAESPSGPHGYLSEEEFFSIDAEELLGVSIDSLLTAGRDLWEKVSPQLHSALCDPNSPQHSSFANAVKKGSKEAAPAVAAILTGLLLSTPLIPTAAVGGIAYFLAKLILETMFEAAYETGCEKWEESLPAEQPQG